MDKITEIKKLIREIVGADPNIPIKGTVTAVSNEQCNVELEGGLKLTNVKLKATVTEGDNFFIAYPKLGSKVLMLSLSGSLDNLCVIKADEVEKIEYQQDGLNFLIDSTDGKISINNTNVSLLDVFTDLSALLKKLKVYTPAGVSGVPIPTSITSIEQFETKFNQLLK